ncbi:MAG: transposase, partial [Gemmatimonadales bacterium]
MWYSGIDQHRAFCVITTYGPDGPRVKQARVPSTALALLEKFNVGTVAELTDLYQLQAGCHQAQIQLLENQVTILERRAPSLLIPNADVQRLLWIPGLGKVNAFTVSTEIGGITRFPSARQFFSYCRLVPGAANSGDHTRHRSGSKAGNRYLKLAFSHAGIRAVQYYPEIRACFKAQARRKPIRIARTLVALELARIV